MIRYIVTDDNLNIWQTTTDREEAERTARTIPNTYIVTQRDYCELLLMDLPYLD